MTQQHPGSCIVNHKSAEGELWCIVCEGTKLRAVYWLPLHYMKVIFAHIY